MAAIIKPTEEDIAAVINAIAALNKIRVVKHMSYAMIAKEANIKESKVRVYNFVTNKLNRWHSSKRKIRSGKSMCTF